MRNHHTFALCTGKLGADHHVMGTEGACPAKGTGESRLSGLSPSAMAIRCVEHAQPASKHGEFQQRLASLADIQNLF